MPKNAAPIRKPLREPAGWRAYTRAFPNVRRRAIISAEAEKSARKGADIAKQFSDAKRYWTGYRIAANFEQLQINGKIDKDTLRGYSAAVNFLLAYGAAETIASARSSKIENGIMKTNISWMHFRKRC